MAARREYNHGSSWESKRETGVFCSSGSVDEGPAGRQHQGGIGKERQQCGAGGQRTDTVASRREKGAVNGRRATAGGERERANKETENIKKPGLQPIFPFFWCRLPYNYDDIKYLFMSVFSTFLE